MNDRRLPIKDLLSTLKASSIRQFTTRFGKIWSNFTVVREGDIMLVAGDDLLFHFDFSKGVVILNPTHQHIRNYDAFKLYIELLSEFYKLEAAVSDLTRNWWTIKITIDGSDKVHSNKYAEKKLSSQFEEFYVESSDDAMYIEAEVVHDKEKPFEVKAECAREGQNDTGSP